MPAKSIRVSRILEWAAIGSIILLAAYLRMGNPGIVEFKRDEANLSLLALDFAHGKYLPLLGIGSSVNFPNAPVSAYLLAIPYFFSSDPIIATEFIASLNVIAVALIYVIGRRYSGVMAGLLAALLLATNPWAVMFSRKIWAQNMLIFFVLAVLLTGLVGYVEGRRWGQLLHLPLLAVVGQIHYGAFVIIPVSLYLLWIGRRRWHKHVVFASLFIAIICFIPYTIGLLRANLANLSAIRSAVASADTVSGSSVGFSPDVTDGTITLLSGRNIHSLVGPEQVDVFLAGVHSPDAVLVIIPLLVMAAAVGFLVRNLGNESQKRVVNATNLGFAFPIAIFALTWTPFHIHYLIPILPYGFLILGFSIDQLLKNHTGNRSFSVFTIAKGLILFFISLIAIVQTILTLQTLNFVATHDTPGGFGTPIHYLHQIQRSIINQQLPVIGQVGGITIGIDDNPTIWGALLYEAPLVRFEDENTHIYPQQASIVLAAECRTNGTQFILRPGEGCFTVYKREVTEPQSTLSIPDNIQSTHFANGVEIKGWHWNTTNACLSLLWIIREPLVQSGEYQFAVQFLNRQEQQIASGDALSWPRRFWLQGDRIERMFCVDADHTNDIVAVRIGMYQFINGDISNTNLINENYQPVGQSFVLDFDPNDTSHSQ